MTEVYFVSILIQERLMASHFKCNLLSEKKRYVCMHVSSYSYVLNYNILTIVFI